MKIQSKKNLKISRRNRHDPDKISQSSTLDQLKQSLHVPSADEALVDFQDDKKDEKSVTYEELREKLRRKIELLRGNRGEKPKEIREYRFDKKRKSVDDGKSEEVIGGKSVNSASSEGEPAIEYGKVRIFSENDADGKRKKKRRMSKEKELERVKRLEEIKRENPTAAEKERWKSATIKALGERVHDDPKLLKQSMKKEKKKRRNMLRSGRKEGKIRRKPRSRGNRRGRKILLEK